MVLAHHTRKLYDLHPLHPVHWVEHRSMKSLAVEHAFAKSCNNYPSRSHQSGSPPFASDLRKWYLKSGWPMLILESESEVGVSWGIPELQKASTTKQCQTMPNHRRTHLHDKWQNVAAFAVRHPGRTQQFIRLVIANLPLSWARAPRYAMTQRKR